MGIVVPRWALILSADIVSEYVAFRNYPQSFVYCLYWRMCPHIGKLAAMDTYTIGDAAKHAGIGASTARDYLKDFPAYFSDDATPEKGTRRVLTWADIETLATIREQRKQGKDKEEIAATLASGERESIQPHVDDTAAGGQTTALITQLTAAASQWEATARTLANERDHLRDELTDERQARLDAENRAVAAETELRILKDITEQQTTDQAEKKSFWQRLFNR